MRKKFYTILFVSLLVFSLVSCGNETGPQNQSGTGRQDVVVVDNDQCAIKITGIDPENENGYTLNAEFENKSSDLTYTYALESAYINGVYCPQISMVEVEPGSHTDADINFYESAVLQENGVGDFTDIELNFRVYDKEAGDQNPAALETAHIYPYGENKVAEFSRDVKGTDNVLIDNADCTVIVTNCGRYWENGYTADIYWRNKTDQPLMLNAEDVKVNGYVRDPNFSRMLHPGKCEFCSMRWAHIEDVKEITCTLRVHATDKYIEADDLVNGAFTIQS